MTVPSTNRAGALSHRRRWQPDVVQSVTPPGVFDLGRGYLEPELLPVDLLRDAYTRAFAEFGSAALSYGDDRGALVLRRQLAARTTAGGPEHVLVTAGTSHGLYLLATRLASLGDLVLVEQKSYDLGRRLLTDCGLRLREVAMDASGMLPSALDDALRAERARGAGVAFVYLIPTFHNPTGLVVPAHRRRELLSVAARHGVLVVEDDAYAELPLTPECTSAGPPGSPGVIRLGTFSKTLGPGLRLGWLLADPTLTDRLVAHAVFRSGGSPNHLASLAVTVLLRSGEYDRHLGWLRTQLRARRDALADALASRLGDTAEFSLPAGGYFVWLRLRGGHTEEALLAAARRADVTVAAGSRFGRDDVPSLRLSYSFNSPARLADAVSRLAGALALERT